MFVVIPIEELRSVSYAKGAYTQREQKFQRRMLASDKHLPNRLELGVAPTHLYSSGNFELMVFRRRFGISLYKPLFLPKAL